MAMQLDRDGAAFELHYCARSRNRTAFYERISTANFKPQTRFHFDDGDADQKLNLSELLAQPDADRHLYVCGPSGFLNFVRDGASAQGWDVSNVHYEYFGAAATEPHGDTDFEIKIASTGTVYLIPAGTSVLAALAAQGVNIPVSCEQGVCGTCLTRVLEGEPDHRDFYLTDAERARNDCFTPCCSRARSARLTLDL